MKYTKAPVSTSVCMMMLASAVIIGCTDIDVTESSQTTVNGVDHAVAQGGSGLPAVTGERAFVHDPGDPDLEWFPCPEFMPDDCRLAFIQGDPTERNADVYFKLQPGTTADHHWHTSDERMVLVSGKMRVDYDGQDPVFLEQGTYAYGPGGLAHVAHCLPESEEPCILFIAFEDPVDAISTEEEPAPGSDEEAFVLTSGEVDFGACPEFMPSGCGLGVIQGNPEEHDADMLLRLAPDSKIPKHWHTSAERMVLISGQMRVNYQGQPPVILHPFTYAYGPAKLPHDAVCKGPEEECILFIAFEEPVDAIDVRGGNLPHR